MAEIGDQDTRVPGEHKKNEIEYQKDIDRFVKVIQGALSTVSVPRGATIVPTLGPAAWTAKDPNQMYITNGRNIFQQEHNNLGAEAVTRGVGGMSTHWTCATPEFFAGIERPLLFKDTEKDGAEWTLLYDAARALIGTSSKEFDYSIRHNVVLKALQDAYPDRAIADPLPLACHRLAKGSPYVQWHAADNVYGDLFEDSKKKKQNKAGKERGFFALLTNTRVTKYHERQDGLNAGHHIELVEVKDLLEDRLAPTIAGDVNFYIKAKIYVTAAGAVATPQILANSGFGGTRRPDEAVVPPIPMLGSHITEQPMAFCQVVLLRELVEDIKNFDNKPDWWKEAVTAHIEAHGKTDPLPIPFQDPEPQVTIPFSKARPWHTQIHRDAFSYGEVGPRVDSRIVVDLRFFGKQKGSPTNRLFFEKNLTDAYGMPQPTFEYIPTTEGAEDTQRMMNDMTDIANKLGAYLPGSEPQFMTPGLALHLGGTTRLGLGGDIKETVGNFNSQVWNFTNLFVAGNGTIPTAFGANPTLTSMCLAFRSVHKISELLTKDEFPPAKAEDVLELTPKEFLNWAFDPTDPNFPNHRLRQPHRSV
ncbi:GMC oxidoreductase [Athelia psychrophila]|uniref:Pyranose 2-oxidase n=1 Tax=Athelia psychrophila TaxID=1759441 RepID=A0A167UA59_9AGAM|nr:GMC oxidoreductase [Fibularhizoctonia sp. CBS 109695]